MLLHFVTNIVNLVELLYNRITQFSLLNLGLSNFIFWIIEFHVKMGRCFGHLKTAFEFEWRADYRAWSQCGTYIKLIFDSILVIGSFESQFYF